MQNNRNCLGLEFVLYYLLLLVVENKVYDLKIKLDIEKWLIGQ